MKRVKGKYLGLAIVISLVTVWIMIGAGGAGAFQDSEDMPAPIGLAPGQTARLNILNRGEERGYIINWKFVDSDGQTLVQSDRDTLIPIDRFMSFDLHGDSLSDIRDRFGRVQLRAVVTAVGNPDTRNLHVSVEVFDNDTGKTTFVLTNPSND